MKTRFKTTIIIALVLVAVVGGILGSLYVLDIIDQGQLKDVAGKSLMVIGILAVVSLAVSALTSSRHDS